MTSKFFSNKKSFDLIEQDPVQQSLGEYWHLKSQAWVPYSWNTNVFTFDEIERIKVIGRRIGVNRAGTMAPNSLEHRRAFTSWIKPNEHTAWIYRRLTDLVNQNNEKYFNFDLSMLEYIQFTYYNSSEKGCYKAHTDPTIWSLPHNRKLSIVMQLSDPSEYEGGDLLLHYSHEPMMIQKEKGMVICFPSYTLHEVTPVTKGERYSLVAWVHGPNFR